jgi:hypothetical protein
MVRIDLIRQAGVMQLPGPLRAAVGIVASAAEEAKRLPDRAIELPMLAVSTALQASLRAQQRYARLAARGDAVLNRRPASDEPPPWATFDDPVSADELRRTALAQLDELGGDSAANRMLDELFGVDDPAEGAGDAQLPAAENHATQAAATAPAPEKAPAKRAAVKKAAGKKAAGKKAAGKKAPAKKAPATKTPAKKNAASKAVAATKAPAKTVTAKKAPSKTAPAKTVAAKTVAATKAPVRKAPGKVAALKSSSNGGKSVNKPRHTAPSRFDTAGD